MGLPVHARFRTLILQAENGPARLKAEFSDIDTGTCELDDWLRVTPPPICGMRFDDPDFRLAMRDTLEAWKPGVIVLDPFNRITMDDKVKDFRKGLDNILETLPEGPERPAIVIVHHLGKQGGQGGQGGQGRKETRTRAPERIVRNLRPGGCTALCDDPGTSLCPGFLSGIL